MKLDRATPPSITDVPGFGMDVVLHILPEENDVRWDEEGWAETYLALVSDRKIGVSSASDGITVNVRVGLDDDVRQVLEVAVSRIGHANDAWIAERRKRESARAEAEQWWSEQQLAVDRASRTETRMPT